MNGIGKRLKEIRETLGLTQTKFAEKIGVTVSAISQFESGKRKPAYDTILKIITTFNLSPNALFPEEDIKKLKR